MNPFVFQSPTKVLFGEFTTSSCGDVLADLGGRKALVVADAFLLESGAIGPLLESLKDPFIFSDVPPDSDVSCVNQAAALARTNKCDCIVAVGGGSVIDTAKVVNICLSLGGGLMDYQGLNILDKNSCPWS
jgi:Alcohol dehydrogenase, class IV